MLLGVVATYLLIACSPLVYYSNNGLGLFVRLFAGACGLDLLLLVIQTKSQPKLTPYYVVLEYLSLISILIAIIVWDTTSTISWASVTTAVPIIFTIASIFRFVAKALQIPRQHADALRFLAFYLSMSIVNIVAIFIIEQLGSILTNITLEKSTSTCVKSPAQVVQSESFVLSDKMDFDLCPLDIWKLVRLNAILGVQIYVMFTLTTTIHNEMEQNQSLVIGISSLALMECLFLTIAVITQFDTLHKCYVFSTNFFVCVWISIGCCFFRYSIQSKWYKGQSPSPTGNQKWPPWRRKTDNNELYEMKSLLPVRIKLKL